MIILIEGVNGSGKSTLAKELSRIFDFKIVHAGPKPKTDEIAISNCQEQLEMDEIILDRATCISRPVYGDDNEDYYGLCEGHLKELGSYLAKMAEKSVIIHTVGKGEHVMKDYYTALHIQEITKNRHTLAKRYDALLEDEIGRAHV